MALTLRATHDRCDSPSDPFMDLLVAGGVDCGGVLQRRPHYAARTKALPGWPRTSTARGQRLVVTSKVAIIPWSSWSSMWQWTMNGPV